MLRPDVPKQRGGGGVEIWTFLPRFTCVVALLITQVVVPRRVRETMILGRYRSFGEATFM